MDDFVFFFFFQAEDGIRDHCVTGVQTCALPIFAAQMPFAGDRHRYDLEAGRIGPHVAHVFEEIDDLVRLVAAYRAVAGAGSNYENCSGEAGMSRQARQAIGHAVERSGEAAPASGRLQQACEIAPAPLGTAALRSAHCNAGLVRPRQHYLLQRSSEASSTIHLTSSSNVMPASAASSGTSDVSVMPGWVLTSRQTKPCVPSMRSS